MNLQKETLRISELAGFKDSSWGNINPEYVARMNLQNRFKTGVEIAKYTSKIIRADIAAYENDPSNYTQSLGCWHGFIAQQMMIAIKRHKKTTKGTYIYLSGWMVAALRSKFGPLPDQSMHEKTAVPELIDEIYTFLKQADARELQQLFMDLDNAKANNGDVEAIEKQIENFETHVVPMIADIDAGFGNEEATYLLAKKMIEAGACCIQIENQVSDAKQCGHQAGKVTVPHEDFLAKVNAVRYAFLELGVDDGVIVARTDSLGANLTQKVPVSRNKGDLADKYNSFLASEPIVNMSDLKDNDIVLSQNGNFVRPIRLANGLYQFKEDTGFDRVVLDCISSLNAGADLLWIETEKPNLKQIADLINAVKSEVPHAKLVYNNSPSFNWTLAFREQVYQEWLDAGKDVSVYPNPSSAPKALMSEKYDETPLAVAADKLIEEFQKDSSKHASIFHHLITLPTYHDTALGTDTLAEGYFGDKGMLAYVKGVQRKEIRRNQPSVKHQDLAGSNIGDHHKEYFSGENALLAGGEANTMNQF